MADGVQSLAAEIRRSISGETWFGPSLSVLLQDVDAHEANRSVNGIAHSLWSLASHLAAWARYAGYRFQGGPARELEEENWPVGAGGETEWSDARASVFAAYESAAAALETLTEEALDVVDALTPVDDMGEPVTLRRIAAGLAQHAAYHAGQIAVTKHLLRTGDASS